MRKLLLLVMLLLVILSVGLMPAQEKEMIQNDVTLPNYTGYISVAPNGRYFVDETGKGFLVIGQNDGVPWPGLSTLLNGLSPQATEAYIQDLRAHGITVSRVMIEYSQEPHTYFENPVGEFSPSMVQFWDDFIKLAEKHGLYLLLTPYDTFWQAEKWGGYPYNAAMGGPCETMHDWLTGRACIEAQKNRWRFIIDKWGGSPNIFAWDIMNEIDIWWNANDAEIEAYVDEMSVFIRDYETEKWGRSRMLSVSSAASTPTGRLAKVIYQHPQLDFANTHLYIGTAIKDPENPIEAGMLMAGGVVLSLQEITDNRPFFDSESGPIDDWIESVPFDKEYHHNMSWGHLAAGGAGSGMRWPYTTPHWILPEMRDNLLGLARVASTIDWANFDSQNINRKIRTDRDHIARIGCSDGQTALVWLLLQTHEDPTVTLPGAVITVSEVLAEGEYTVEFWETYEGKLLSRLTVQVVNGELAITLPDMATGLKDLAILIRSIK